MEAKHFAVLDPVQKWLLQKTSPLFLRGGLNVAIKTADDFIGVSGPGVLTRSLVQKMAKDPVILALANPEPQIPPQEALGYCRILATGRNDLPNQINNVLAFPGIFRGALDVRASDINEAMKLAVARAIAAGTSSSELNEDILCPAFSTNG